MRLTLRTLLAYLDDTLEPAQAKTIGQKVAESDTAQELITRIKQVTRRRRLTTPPDTGPGAKLDPNVIAEYLDNTLDADQFAEVEQTCLASDVHLAEMASCHQILTLVLGEPALVPPTAKQRMYGLVKGREAIAFRKPPPSPRAADAEADPVEGKEVDETLRLGVPALRSKDPWANRLILMGGAFGLVACLVVAILMLVIPGNREDDLQPQAKADVKKGNGQKKVGDGKKQGQPVEGNGNKTGKEDKQVVPPGDKKGAENKKLPDEKKGDTGKKGDDKKGDDGNKNDKVIEAPKGPAEEPPGPPSKRVVEIGTYEPPMPPATIAVLLQANPGGKSAWVRLKRDLKPPRVLTGRPLVSLPAFRSIVKTDGGIRLTLAGTVPEFFPIVPLYESRVVLHQHDALDLDLTLERGRILLTNLRADRPARVRVRFENTTNPDSREMWDLTLEGKDTEVLIDRWSFYDGDPFYENPKHPNRKGPLSNLGLIVLRGSITLRADSVTHSLNQPPGPALMFWESRRGPGGPRQMTELPPWTKANPPTPKGPESLRQNREDMERAAVKLGTDVSGWAVELGLEKALASPDKARRKLAIRSFGALDMVPQLVEALGDANRPDVRADAIETLRYWIAASRDNAYALFTQLKGSDYTAVESEKIVSLLHSYSAADLGRLETYSTLIDQLVSPKVAIRDLAAWHLYILVPEAQKQLPWSATATPQELQRIRAGWREMIQKGKLPPAKAPTGG